MGLNRQTIGRWNDFAGGQRYILQRDRGMFLAAGNISSAAANRLDGLQISLAGLRPRHNELVDFYRHVGPLNFANFQQIFRAQVSGKIGVQHNPP